MNDVIERKNNLLKNRKGFTLIELIVVIVIIGILAAIVIPRLATFQSSARYKADVATAKTIATAAVTYMTEKNLASVADPTNDLKTYFDGQVYPTPQHAGGTFALTTASGGVTSIIVDGNTLYPNPPAATPANY